SGAPFGTTLPAPAEPGGSVSGHSEWGLSSRHSSIPMALRGPLPYPHTSVISAWTLPRYRSVSMFHGQRRVVPPQGVLWGVRGGGAGQPGPGGPPAYRGAGVDACIAPGAGRDEDTVGVVEDDGALPGLQLAEAVLLALLDTQRQGAAGQRRPGHLRRGGLRAGP